jgi:hypothetical protein
VVLELQVRVILVVLEECMVAAEVVEQHLLVRLLQVL